MPRNASQTRRPTEEDLTERQREIYSHLPAKLRQAYLDELPPIRISTALQKRKLEKLKAQLDGLDRILPSLQKHRQKLEQAVRELESGGDPRRVDLRELLRPPTLEGAVLRYVRSGRR